MACYMVNHGDNFALFDLLLTCQNSVFCSVRTKSPLLVPLSCSILINAPVDTELLINVRLSLVLIYRLSHSREAGWCGSNLIDLYLVVT